MTCGGGIRVRSRTCNGPSHGGQPCEGKAREEQFCNDNPCRGAFVCLHQNDSSVVRGG